MAGRRQDETTPRIDPPRLRGLITGDPDDLRADAGRDGERFDAPPLAGRDLRGLVLDGCALTDVSFEDADLRTARFLESSITGVRATTLRAAGSTWRDVQASAWRIGAAELWDSEWIGTAVGDSKFDYLNLQGATLRDVVLRDCVLEGLDLRDTTCTRVALVRCRIGTLDVAGARFVDLDLRGSSLRVVDSAAALRGAIVDGDQLGDLAPLLAEAAGITVLPSVDRPE
ncbi:pentapeptide repeat-containing protein [uncultured Amnibacterium sp.]|uniref:pentapeptide repeat-containing protein n=1 Tax=uncultured Amnibacterium sp. TaxID=1631851 RepID=UPI0035CB3674